MSNIETVRHIKKIVDLLQDLSVEFDSLPPEVRAYLKEKDNLTTGDSLEEASHILELYLQEGNKP
jgi:hypothetical protein